MISSFFERGRFALTLRTARSLLGGATGLEQPREPYVQGVTAYSAVICWVSQHPGSGVVEYGKTPELGRKETDSQIRRRHVVKLAGLDPGSTYHYRVGGVVESSSKGSLRISPARISVRASTPAAFNFANSLSSGRAPGPKCC